MQFFASILTISAFIISAMSSPAGFGICYVDAPAGHVTVQAPGATKINQVKGTLTVTATINVFGTPFLKREPEPAPQVVGSSASLSTRLLNANTGLCTNRYPRHPRHGPVARHRPAPPSRLPRRTDPRFAVTASRFRPGAVVVHLDLDEAVRRAAGQQAAAVE